MKTPDFNKAPRAFGVFFGEPQGCVLLVQNTGPKKKGFLVSRCFCFCFVKVFHGFPVFVTKRVFLELDCPKGIRYFSTKGFLGSAPSKEVVWSQKGLGKRCLELFVWSVQPLVVP